MKIQSLSISVPAECGNECAFCVAHMHRENYKNQIRDNDRFLDLYEDDYVRRMAFARDNGCNAVLITGNGEPLLNKQFLKFFAGCNRRLEMPFRQIELQTSGMLLDDGYLRFLRNYVGVSVISVSLSAMDSDGNAEYNRPKNGKFRVDIPALCAEIKRYDFALRLSLNMTDKFDAMTVEGIFARAVELGADQLTFRILYESENDTPQDRWIREHRVADALVQSVRAYIQKNGRPLLRLPFGAIKYSVNGISVVMDEDCMSTGVGETLKYLILREDCKLYSHWDDKGSLIF